MKLQYQRDGDDTFWVLHDGKKVIRGRLKNFMGGLTKVNSLGKYPQRRSDLKWLTDRDYNGK